MISAATDTTAPAQAEPIPAGGGTGTGDAETGQAALALTVYYNGSCSVCAAEIDHYRRLPQESIAWIDVSQAPGILERVGVDRDTIFRRMHAQDADGALYAGLDAFIATWRRIPRYRWVAGLVDRPVIRPIGHFLYEQVAAPVLFRMHKRRVRKGAVHVGG